MEPEIEKVDVDTTETDTDVEADSDTSEQKDAPERKQETPEAKLARLDRQAARLRKQLGKDEPVVEQQKPDKTGELDLSQLAYLRSTLNVKGQAEIALVREYMKAGKDILDLEGNRHFINDLKDLREAVETKTATPTSTRRSGVGGGNDLDLAIAEYEQTQKLPKDFTLRSQVVEAMERKHGDNTPPWLK